MKLVHGLSNKSGCKVDVLFNERGCGICSSVWIHINNSGEVTFSFGWAGGIGIFPPNVQKIFLSQQDMSYVGITGNT